MRAKVKHHFFLAFAENHAVGQGRAAGGDLDGAAAGVVEDAVFEGPAVGVPDPAGDGAVDEGGPPEGEDHGGDEAAAFGDGAHDDCGGYGAEHHLCFSSATILAFPRTVRVERKEGGRGVPGRKKTTTPESTDSPATARPASSSTRNASDRQ